MKRDFILFLACWLFSWAVNAQCTSSAPPYSTNFSTFLPTCWEEASDGTPATGPTSLGSGDWSQSGSLARVNLYDIGVSDWLLTPEFDLSVPGTWEMALNFDAVDFLSTVFTGMGSDDTVQVVISTDGGVTWAPLYTWDVNNPPTVNSTDIIIDLSSYTGTSNLFGIWASEGATNDPEDYYFNINTFDIRMPITCAFPTNPIISNVTATTADLTWTENGTATVWQLEYGPAGFTPGTGTQMPALTNPTTAMNLMDGVDYEIYVRAICGPGDTSLWSTSASFRTLCTAAVPSYSYDFTSFLGTCWSEAVGVLGSNTTLTGTTSRWREEGYRNVGTTGAATINNYGTTSREWLISRSIDLGTAATSYQLEFDIALTNWNNTALDSMGVDDSLIVVISTDNGATWDLANSLVTYDINNQPTNAGSREVINISAYTGVVKIGFYALSNISNTDYDIHIDNFAVLPLQSCAAPTNAAGSNITATSVDIIWTENGTATLWELEYGPIGFTLGTGMRTTALSNPTNVLSLMDDTSYEVYVRAVCGPGDTSLWSIAGTFRTLCGAPAVPTYTYDFTSFLGACWSAGTGILGNTTTLTGTTSRWREEGYRNVGTTGAATINNFGTTSREWLISRSIDLGTGALTTYQVEFDIALTNWNTSATDNMGADDSLVVVVSTDNGATWSLANSLVIYDVNNQPTNAGSRTILSLAGYTGVVKIGFYAASSVSNTDYDIHIDNFVVNAAPQQYGDLVITEIMYNSPETNTDSLEFIEIQNTGLTPIDLNNLSFTSGITYSFPATVLAPGDYYVITVNAAAFNTVYGAPADDVFTGGLSNGGELLLLVDPMGNTIDSVNYDDGGVWPGGGTAQGSPDGGGASLVLCDASTDNADGANWSASTTSINVTINNKDILASPGAANGCIAAVDVAVDTLLLDDVYCNVTAITGAFIVTNNSANDATNVIYNVTLDQNIIGTGTIATLAANASDTISVGPVPVIGLLGSGVVEVTVTAAGDTDPNNDVLSKTVYLSDIDASIMTTATVDCSGDSTGALMASTVDAYGVSMYQWNTGDMTASISNLPAGAYMVTATDSIGCMDTAMVTLTEPLPVVITGAPTDVACNGDSTGSVMIAVAGGTAPYTYLWSNGATGVDLINVPADMYTVTVTDANGCMAMQTYTVNEPAPITLTITHNNMDSATAIPAGGVGAYSFSWSHGPTTATVGNLMNNTTYMVTVSDANGCTVMDSVTISFINVSTVDGLNSLSMFPNPTSDQVFVDLDLATTASVQINITNAIGQLVSTQALGNIQTQRVELSTKDLPNGLYLVQFHIGGEQVTRKLIVRRK